MTAHSQLPRIFVDFNYCDRLGRVRLNTVGTMRDLNQSGIVLREGMEVFVGCLELEVEGTAHYSTEEGIWVAQVDWDKFVNYRATPESWYAGIG